jgi:hypothetical protein
MINGEGFGRKRSWPNLRCYADICLETEENHENPQLA